MNPFEYKTQVKIDLNALRREIPALEAAYNQVGHRNTTKGRSLFCAFNNTQKFFDRCMEQALFQDNKDFVQFSCIGSSKGGTARIYFKPSVTSLPKVVRKSVIPINPDNVFAYCDIRSAEFALTCFFAGETEAIEAYHRGEDIYMHYSYIFPPNTDRAIIKKALLSYFYNVRAYTIAKDLGITETQAQRLLDKVGEALPRLTLMKNRVMKYDRLNQGYYCPNGFDQSNLVKVSDIDPLKGFSPDYACNCYIQSALGLIFQNLTTKLQPRISGTLLTVFDSVFAEINPNSLERYQSFIRELIYPLAIDDVTIGKTMWDAAYN